MDVFYSFIATFRHGVAHGITLSEKGLYLTDHQLGDPLASGSPCACVAFVNYLLLYNTSRGDPPGCDITPGIMLATARLVTDPMAG